MTMNATQVTANAHKLAERIEDVEWMTLKQAQRFLGRLCDILDDPETATHLDRMMITRLARLAGSIQSEFQL